MATAVLFAPSLRGHRQTYCRVLAQILLDDGFHVSVVGGVEPARTAQGPARAPQLADLEKHSRYRFVPLPASGMPLLQNSPAGFTALLDELAADAVVLTEADTCLPLLNARAARHRRPRRWVGIFIRTTNYAHEQTPQHRSRSARGLSSVRHARTTLLHWRRDPWLFHEVLLHRLRLLDGALYLDETFVAAHGRSAQWLPDIFTARPWRNEENAEETRAWAQKLDAFMTAQNGRPAFVYIGTNQVRRGYDTLLRLAVAEDGCFVHCGRRAEEEGYRYDIELLRRQLQARDALFETGAYYEADATADLFLRRGEVVVLPHRGHLGSSGVMLQAVAAGRPVLVPDRGLMAERVRAFGLGRTYRAEDWNDLRRQYRALRSEGRQHIAANTYAFMSFFSREQTENALRFAMGSGPAPARLPAHVPGWNGRET